MPLTSKRIHSITVAAFIVVITVLVAAVSATAQLPSKSTAGIRTGVGTDINGGIAFGGELTYTRPTGQHAIQLSLDVFGNSFSESTNEGIFTYDETTDLVVAGILANFLFDYSLESSGPYFVFGFGAGGVSVSWEERSRGDTSLGTALAGGGSMQSEEGSAGGMLFNLGIGHRFNEQFDLRLQTPTFVILGGPEGASSTVPTITVTAGLQF